VPLDVRALGGVIDVVADHGAAGDGVADDSGAIAAAIAAAGGAGGIVYFPPGVYRLGSRIELRSGVSLLGAGSAVSTLRADAGVAAGVIVGLQADAITDVTVSQLTVDGAGLAGVNGVQVTAGRAIVVERLVVRDALRGIWLNDTVDSRIVECDVRGAADDGIEASGARTLIVNTRVLDTGDAGVVLTNAAESRVQGCRLEGVGRGGTLTHGVAVLADSHGVTVVENSIAPSGGMGIFGDASQSLVIADNLISNSRSTLECIGITRTCTDTVIQGNHAFDGQDNGISCSAPRSIVSSNRVAGAQFMGIQVNGSDCTVTGNVVSDSGRRGGTAPWAGIDLNGVSGCVVTSNRCFDTFTPPTQRYGIVSRAGADRNVVVANHLQGNGVAGLALVGSADVVGLNLLE
jgi:polygalacturonase